MCLYYFHYSFLTAEPEKSQLGSLATLMQALCCDHGYEESSQLENRTLDQPLLPGLEECKREINHISRLSSRKTRRESLVSRSDPQAPAGSCHSQVQRSLQSLDQQLARFAARVEAQRQVLRLVREKISQGTECECGKLPIAKFEYDKVCALCVDSQVTSQQQPHSPAGSPDDSTSV